MTDQLAKRGRALEQVFFAKRDAELLAAFREKLDAEKLGELTGIHCQEVLEHLTHLGVNGESVAALGLIPLVEVAWADGRIEPAEREAVLEAAFASGIKTDSAAYSILSQWLNEKPEPGLREDWKSYVEALTESMDGEAKNTVKHGVIGRAEAVAKAAGGILGIGAISSAEREVLTDLESAF